MNYTDILSYIYHNVKSPVHRKKYLEKNYPDVYREIINEYSWVDSTTPFNELLYILINNYTYYPKCKTCNGKVSWDRHNLKYKKYCSPKCSLHKAINKAKEPQTKEKRKETLLNNYGVENSFCIPEVKKYNTEKKREYWFNINGHCDDYNTLKLRFDWNVKYYTDRTYSTYKDILDPNNLRGRQYHIDHMYSKYDAFKNNVPIKILCHWSNLILVHQTENLTKNRKSNKTIEELYDDYYNSSIEYYNDLIKKYQSVT